MRLSDSDRELLYERLKRHAAEGRIGIEELERRVAAVALAETRDDAAAVMADLPPLSGEPARLGGKPSGLSGEPPGVYGGPPGRRRWGWRRGHGDADAPDPAWRPTQERFRDPRTNRVMRVWVDQSGGRHYVPE